MNDGFWKLLNLWILSTETSPMSHVTATVMGGSHSYLEGSDPKTENDIIKKFG